ncbi:murein hydrolase activator NlpD [Orbus mooreae]|uniref:murein hydrolase activator NlpD n=1 Tax=Orbus mooreae TaxID=3074107 RepID=UPI00370D129D
MITQDNLKINRNFAKISSISLLAFSLIACSQTNSAQIKDLSDSPSSTVRSNNNSTSYDSSSAYVAPPKNITAGSVNTTNNVNTSTSTVKSNGNIVTTTQERIVYNRNYDEIPKGGYKDNSYTVQRGDTLFYVAWITGNDFRSLAAKNNIAAPYELSVGQVLDVSGGTTVVVTQQTTTNANTAKPIATTTTTTTTTSSKIQPPTQVTTTATKTESTTASTAVTSPSATVANITWQWPVKGKLIETFSNSTKGIDIAGSLGDSIQAAAAGRVVYAGNALPGYGNLIIIKHNDDYLTAYAHNQSILVKEQQDVKAGQQIATMGNTGTSSVRLHFEIRYQAKSVDPLKFLPKQ